VQGRDEAADDLVAQAISLEAAGAFGIVLEMVPAEAARRITDAVTIPTVGIGAGPHCDAQVLVWQDMMGLRTGRMPRFVKQYADLATTMTEAAQAFAADVAGGSFPEEEHSF
jgi:3-methyl-2-oxobutanoate hydroxymethyltransferase